MGENETDNQLANINHKLDMILGQHHELSERVSRLEIGHRNDDDGREGDNHILGEPTGRSQPPLPTLPPRQAGNDRQQDSFPIGHRRNTGAVDSTESSREGAVDNLQEQYNCLKTSLDRVILPPHLKLHDSRCGINRNDQPVLNVISKCGRYIESALKWTAIQTNRPNHEHDVSPEDMEQLFTILHANLKYLQDEFAALLVQGRFDNDTARLFKSLQKGTAGFDDLSLRNVRIAAELSSTRSRFPPERSGYRGSSYRGRGRFQRGGAFGRSDMFTHMTSGANFPNRRGQGWNQGQSGQQQQRHDDSGS